MKVGIVNGFKPGQHAAVRPKPAQFRHHLGIEQKGHGLQGLNENDADSLIWRRSLIRMLLESDLPQLGVRVVTLAEALACEV